MKITSINKKLVYKNIQLKIMYNQKIQNVDRFHMFVMK